MLEKLNEYHEKGLVYKQIHPTLPLTIWNYSEKVQYENLWDEITLMCRGLVTDNEGNISARAFKKFFNIEEGKHTPTEKFEVWEKMDGSLGIVFWYEGQWVVATRGSFTSDQAIKAKELLKKYNSGKNIGFTAIAHLKAKGLIPRADGTKRKSDKYKELGGEVDKLIEDGIVELKMYDTTNEHSKIYGFDAQKPLYIQSIIVSEEHRGKGIGSKVMEYILDYANKNGHDVIFGHITQKAEPSVDVIKSMIQKSGFNTIEGNNDFYKVINDRDMKFKEGGEVDEHKETYKKWKSLVNMSYSELKRFYDSEEGKVAGLKPSEAKAQGIDSGRESARWIMKMKKTPVSEWTPTMWKWAKKQISFISRMSGAKGDLYDDKGNKTRKYLSLLIWGNDPKKYKSGGETQNDMKFNEPIMYHEKDGNFFVGKNTIYYWLYDDKEAGKKLNDGEFDFVLFPPATLGMASQKGFVPPLQLIWTKKYQNKTKGSEHLMGIIEAYYDEENKKLYIKMMTANPKMRGKGIMSYLIKNLRQEFKLSQDDVIFVNTTKEGKRFEEAKHYADGGLIAPNGRHSNLTPEQYELVRTPEFKAWFGDWENNPESASKVVDENGEPMVCYHGTRSRFDIFDIEKGGESNKLAKVGFWFTPKSQFAYNFSNSSWWGKQDPFVYPVFLSIKTPKIFITEQDDYKKGIIFGDSYEKFRIDIYKIEGKNEYDANAFGQGLALKDEQGTIKKYRDMLFEEGYDGIFIKNTRFDRHNAGGYNDQYVALYPEQIKLANGINTTFDPNSPNMRYDYGGELEKLGFTEQEIQTWKKQNKVKQKQKQNPNVKESAIKLQNGEISQDEYIKEVRKYMPILPFTEIPQIPTLLEIVGSLDSNKVEKGIIGYSKFLEDGEQVATRLDIPAYEDYDVWVVSVHDAKEKNSIGYGQTAYLKDINFITSPKVALNIATEKSSKNTIARMKGSWINKDPHEVREMAVKYMNNPEWVQVGMNPYRHSWFYDKTDGMPLLTAEELIQVGALVLAKKPVKTTPDNPVFAVDKNNPDIKFKKGGIFKKHKSIEQIAKEKNVSLYYAKEQLKKGMKVESEHSDSKEVQETIALQHLDEMINYYDKLKTIEN